MTLQKTQCTFCCANKNLIKMSEKEVSMCTLSSKWKREFATYIIELPRNTRAIDFLHHVAFAFQIEEQKLANTTMSCVWAIFTYVFYNTLLNLDSFAIRIFGDFLFIQHMKTGLTFFVAFEFEDIFLVLKSWNRSMLLVMAWQVIIF